MQLYYKAISKKSEVIHGRVEANDKTEAARYLRSHDLYPIKITSEKEQVFSRFVPFYRHASLNDLIFITRQLSSMLLSGLTLMQALGVMRSQIRERYMSEMLQGIVSDIQDGHTFAQALGKYPTAFSPVYVSMIQAGEKAGLLDKVLERLAVNLEKSKELRDTIRGALIYPAMVVIIMIVVLGIMMFFVIPQLAGLYKSLNVTLPLVTQIVIGISNFFINNTIFVIFILAILIYLFRKWYKTPAGRLFVDRNVLKIPLLGRLISETQLVEFTRTFSLLISTGSLVVESLNQCATTMGNMFYRNAIKEVANRVEKGVLIGDAIAANDIFPPILVEMTKIGEQTGKLDESLMRVSAYFEREVEQAIKALTTAIEPIILVVLGIGVAFLIISIITPIYTLITAIK